MGDFEKKLESVPVPQVRVPEFQARLRDRLLDSYDAVRSAARMKRWFVVSSVAAAVLLAVSVMFVARPAVPTALHARLGGEDQARIARVMGWVSQEKKAEVADLQATPAVRDEDPVVRTMELDRSLVQKWLDERGDVAPSSKLRGGEMFTVSTHKLPNNREIYVLTSFPQEKASRPKVIY